MKSAESTEEIDAVLQKPALDTGADSDPEISLLDLNHLDRIPKSQLRALHLVHENFVRNLASSLSAYLRSYVALNLVSLGKSRMPSSWTACPSQPVSLISD